MASAEEAGNERLPWVKCDCGQCGGYSALLAAFGNWKHEYWIYPDRDAKTFHLRYGHGLLGTKNLGSHESFAAADRAAYAHAENKLEELTAQMKEVRAKMRLH